MDGMADFLKRSVCALITLYAFELLFSIECSLSFFTKKCFIFVMITDSGGPLYANVGSSDMQDGRHMSSRANTLPSHRLMPVVTEIN